MLHHELPEMFSIDLIQETAVEFIRSINPFEVLDDDWEYKDIIYQYENGSLSIRKIENHILIVIYQNTVNTSMLTVGINVMASKIKNLINNEEFQMPDSQKLDSRTSLLSSTSIPVMSSSHSYAPVNAIYERDDDTREVNSIFIKELISLFAREVGPVAKPLVKKGLKLLGKTKNSLNKSSALKLIDLLGNEITDALQNDTFVKKAQILLNQTLK